jgi:YVTN family beta-propeller protein
MVRPGRLEWLVLATALTAWGCGSSGPSQNDAKAPDGPTGDGAPGPDGGGLDVPAPSDGPGVDAPAAGPEAGGNPGADGAVPAMARKTPTNGSAIAITADDKWAVAANRTAGRVSVFKVDLPGGAAATTKTADLDVGKTSEPWAVVIGNDDNTAYVILRREQQVVRIKNLRGTATVDTRTATGSEPTGLAISPTGKTLYVANWADGTVSLVDSGTMMVTTTVDLNPALAASGSLGQGVQPRLGMAHPRAVVVTNNGDGNDADERVYVTEFFSQATTGTVPGDDSQFDVGRVGMVYHFDGAGTVGMPITIGAVANTGFSDSKGGTTGCFPNQLYAAALNSGRLYVTSVCQSPRGPVGADIAPSPPGGVTSNFTTQVHAAVFVIDAVNNKELPGQGVLLTREFSKLYTTLNAPDDASRRLPLIPNDIMFAAGSTFGYVSSYGSDAVYRIAYRPDGSLERVGADARPFIDLRPVSDTIAPGNLPIGIASANAGVATAPFAVALNENTRNISLISFGTQTVLGAVPSTDQPAATGEQAANRGKRFFATGLGRWSLAGQAWNSCESCHPDGLTDNVTWFFARGPRQTISLDASYDPQNPTHRRVLNWSGIFDEIHDFEGNTRGNSGGVGAIVHRAPAMIGAEDRIIFEGTAPIGAQIPTPTPQAGLNGSTASLMPGGTAMPKSVLPDWDDIDAYVRTIRSPRGVVGLNAADVAEGKKLFEANACAGCHGTSHWTLSGVFYTPNEANNAAMGLLRTTEYTRPATFPMALNPPSSGAGGKALLRFTDANPMVVGANDQINCVLRAVGTYPATGGGAGIAPAGVFVKEVRQDMTTPSQGATGFNIPSLLGMVTGAPYFHAGNARTLEEAFGDTFDRHRRALAENFRPDSVQIRQLVSYLLSIDESTTAHALPALGFALDLCAQTPAGVIR